MPPPKRFRWRYRFLLTLLVLAFLGITWRVIDLTIFKHPFLQKQGDARALRVLPIPAYRGIIFDRNHEPLAMSVPVISIWIHPQEFKLDHPAIPQLIKLLNINQEQLTQKIKSDPQKEFLYIKRQISPKLANHVKALDIPGIYYQKEFRRFYPESQASAQLIGFTNIDDEGQEGIELAYNQTLAGIPGFKKVIKDRFGHVISELDVLREPKPGHDLQLSIDRRIQYIAYQALQKNVEKFHAEAGSVIVLDTRTNEILAITNYPSFNPNQRENKLSEKRNRAVTDVFEPGSTIKTFSIANALESGKYQPNTLVDTRPGWMIVDKKRISDVHNKGIIDLTSVLKYSSNVGVTKITLNLPQENLWKLLHKLGFGELTKINLPGERTGSLKKHFIWKPFTLATLSFGYGMDATLLQLAQAYATLAHQGMKIPLSITPVTIVPEGIPVLSQRTAKELLTMLEGVTEKGGTAPLARIPGYPVAGKTSTSFRVGPQGYLKHNYNSSFIGIVPSNEPRLLVAVVLYNLSGNTHFGGYTAGPVFADIASQTLRLLAIPLIRE